MSKEFKKQLKTFEKAIKNLRKYGKIIVDNKEKTVADMSYIGSIAYVSYTWGSDNIKPYYPPKEPR